MRTQQCLVLTSESYAYMEEEYFLLKGDYSWLNYHPYVGMFLNEFIFNAHPEKDTLVKNQIFN